ncbi:MAG TPA: class I SAM-dependent methyltransferase, partial [Blastocatellia bacterium]|nr:class I SAM-dependent methyltransferase [Blastocatellia bacterium]
EWPPEMLHAAGLLTLDLADSLHAEGLGLKDATPYNILFRGPEPVFVDLLSFERRAEGDSIWLPSAQFERTFLLPLLVNKKFGITINELLTTRRDGLEPEEIYNLCGTVQKLVPPFLTLVSLPTWLAAKRNRDDLGIYEPKRLENAEKAHFILGSLYKRLRRMLDRLKPEAGRASAWSDYMASNNNYSREHFAAKQDFVERAGQEFGAKRVLDVGCNDGHFSALCARSGASVVAVDNDPVVVGNVWRKARAEKLDILPLVIDLSRPSPAIGWRNRECQSFLDRARRAFDCVLMLAVIHHLLVTERIPLDEIVELAAELTTDMLIIEFIAPQDSMFRRIVRGRDNLFRHLTVELFEATCRRHFEIIRSQHMDQSSRWLYLLRKRR